MSERSITHGSFVIERKYPAKPEKVFAAFADPAKKRRWYTESRGLDLENFTMDFRVGGHDHTQYRFKEGTPFPGDELINNACYQEIATNERIVMAYTMTMGTKRFSASLATFEFRPSVEGTEMTFTEQGAFFEGSDGPQMREAGWRELLDSLGKELAR